MTSVALPGDAPWEETPRRVVFDTNAVLSLWAFTDSRFAPLRVEVDSGRWIAFTSDECLAEFRRVLDYPQFKFDVQRQADAYDAYVKGSRRWDGAPGMESLPRCKDRDDQKFLELARDVRASYLVTSDKLLLRCNRRERLAGLFQIITPDTALRQIDGPDRAHSSHLAG